MRIRLFLLSIFVLFCMNSQAEDQDTTIYKTVRHAIENPTDKNTIDVYNHIVKSRCFRENVSEYPFGAIKQSLQNDEIAIEVLALPKSNDRIEYVAFTVRNHYKSPHIIHLFEEEKLNRELEKGEAMYTDTNMASLLLMPLYIEMAGARTIFFTPAGKLHQFAIEYCNVEEGVMLAEKYQFYRLTSAVVLTNRKDKQKLYDSYVLYGGIDFGALPEFEEEYEGGPSRCQFGYLQDSYRAAIDIHRLLTEQGLQVMLYAKKEATEFSFKKLSGKDIPVFFIETHSNADHQKLETGPDALLFAGSCYVLEGGVVPTGYEDGLLSFAEIVSMDLSNMDLAVISACKSALGEVDWKGVNGLMRSFKTAGVNALVMTTDDVVDYVAGEVWKAFFRNLLKGKGKRESLLEAVKQVRTIRGGFYASPKYWAAFILLDGLD